MLLLLMSTDIGSSDSGDVSMLDDPAPHLSQLDWPGGGASLDLARRAKMSAADKAAGPELSSSSVFKASASLAPSGVILFHFPPS